MRTNSKSLGDLLFGQTRSRILALLYGKPDQTFFVRQIAREIGTSVGSVQRELETLSEVGLLNRTTIGRQVFYQANRHHPTFAEVRSLIAKTSGIFHQLRSALAPFTSQITFALVYGSIARGDEDAGSDVDLMIVGNVTLDDVLAQLTPVENAIGRPINPTVYSLKEFRTKVKDGNHFLTSVLRGKKMLLIGDEDELSKVG
ncbi:MAG TPA: nucleotidyltransferase domain-containing protein [Acidobacteriaceae bacterium]|jgi:predicted nucleotidyltransferase|nr:nucleotidyltransferase domain-containing protein [Acidobacteriaceae bacterium]